MFLAVDVARTSLSSKQALTVPCVLRMRGVLGLTVCADLVFHLLS